LIKPRCFNLHCTAQFSTFARLQRFVDWVMRDYWFWFRWLCSVPFFFSLIKLARQGQLEPPLTYSLFEPTLPAWLAKADQSFFPFSARSA